MGRESWSDIIKRRFPTTATPPTPAKLPSGLDPAPVEDTDSKQWNALVEMLTQGQNAQLEDDRAAAAYDREYKQQLLALEERKFALSQQESVTDATFKAAELATGPTGAIQLAYMARNQGAPQQQIHDIFQNLPFVKALLAGQALPGFGVPEQLGGPSDRVNTTGGGTFGLTLPDVTGITEHQWSGMSASEQSFYAALRQSETGIPIEDSLKSLADSFLPTTGAQPISISR